MEFQNCFGVPMKPAPVERSTLLLFPFHKHRVRLLECSSSSRLRRSMALARIGASMRQEPHRTCQRSPEA